MKKAIDLAKMIVSDPEANYIPEIKDREFFSVFSPIYKMKEVTMYDANLIVAFLIFAYDPDSLRINLSKDRIQNKVDIFESLGVDVHRDLISEIINNDNEEFTESVSLYLEKLTDWRWISIYSQIEYHSKIMRFVSKKTEEEISQDRMLKDGVVKTMTKDIDIDVVSRVNIQKSDLMKRATESRREADRLIEEIRKDFMNTDAATQHDFGFQFTETAKKPDVMSWRGYIKDLKDGRKIKQ